MPVIGTYNGVSIVGMPPTPAFREVNLKKHNSVAAMSSPFTGQVQTQSWPGADWWYAEVTLPQLRPADARAWSAFFSSCRGMLNVFPWGHPGFARPSGRFYQSRPVVNGVNTAMATSLSTRGWAANFASELKPGDLFQLGSVGGTCRLHEVIDYVDSDAAGNSTFSIFPSLRENVADGVPLVVANPQGLFRLATNDTSSLMTQTRLSGMSFTIIEAR